MPPPRTQTPCAAAISDSAPRMGPGKRAVEALGELALAGLLAHEGEVLGQRRRAARPAAAACADPVAHPRQVEADVVLRVELDHRDEHGAEATGAAGGVNPGPGPRAGLSSLGAAAGPRSRCDDGAVQRSRGVEVDAVRERIRQAAKGRRERRGRGARAGAARAAAAGAGGVRGRAGLRRAARAAGRCRTGGGTGASAAADAPTGSSTTTRWPPSRSGERGRATCGPRRAITPAARSAGPRGARSTRATARTCACASSAASSRASCGRTASGRACGRSPGSSRRRSRRSGARGRCDQSSCPILRRLDGQVLGVVLVGLGLERDALGAPRCPPRRGPAPCAGCSSSARRGGRRGPAGWPRPRRSGARRPRSRGGGSRPPCRRPPAAARTRAPCCPGRCRAPPAAGRRRRRAPPPRRRCSAWSSWSRQSHLCERMTSPVQHSEWTRASTGPSPDATSPTTSATCSSGGIDSPTR